MRWRGTVVARYGGLVVLDADGARLDARLVADAGGARIEIDDAAARYPIVIDPLLFATEEAELTNPRGTASGRFGNAVAMSDDGSRVVVGAELDDRAGARSGSARVFRRSGTTWTPEAELVPTDLAPGDLFGTAVAMSADGAIVVVGIPGDDTNGGSARVFRRSGTTWAEEATLRAVDTINDDALGTAVAIAGDGSRIAVGAPGDDQPAANSGSVLMFRWTGSGWTLESIFWHASAAANDRAGSSVSINATGTYLVFGVPGRDAGGTDIGLAAVFVRAGLGWMPSAEIRPADALANDAVGASVAISALGDRILLGVPGDDSVLGTNVGSVRVFARTGALWNPEAALDDGGSIPSGFGFRVSLSGAGDRALVGAPDGPRAGGVLSGVAHLFARTGSSWGPIGSDRIESTTVGSVDKMGSAVALAADGTRAVIGAPGAPGTAGRALVFTVAAALPVGSPCSSPSTCELGNCVDGFCCDRGCRSPGAECRGCAARLTGGADGICAVIQPSAAYACRASAGPCDPAELCDGTAVGCPAVDARSPAGSPCRMSAGACDAVEVCDGTSVTCPGDTFASGVTCRAPVGPCDVEERCGGLSAECPVDMLVASGVTCRPASGACDRPDACDGASPTCTDTFAPITAACGDVPSGECDSADHCAGTSADCVAAFLAGVECRASTGGCDPAESCTGASATCPLDMVLPTGVSCRPSTAACDPEEVCDGASATCPADLSTCPDTGSADVGAPDAGDTAEPDGGAPDTGPPPAAPGCRCRASGRPPAWPVLMLLALLAVPARHAQRTFHRFGKKPVVLPTRTSRKSPRLDGVLVFCESGPSPTTPGRAGELSPWCRRTRLHLGVCEDHGDEGEAGLATGRGAAEDVERRVCFIGAAQLESSLRVASRSGSLTIFFRLFAWPAIG